MNTKRILLILVFLITFFSGYNSMAQNASIVGKITDESTGEGLPGAVIMVPGTSIGTITNFAGEYKLTNLSPGSYEISYTFIGYMEQEKDFELSAGEVKEYNVEMSYDTKDLGEVVVSAQALGQMGAINQQRASNSISNIVSSDKIKEVPDVNAAESIGRLPGVALLRSGGEGNQVVIRGLNPQFSSVMLDGVRLEGTGLNRSVGLSPISSEMLDGIELTKSLTADKDADAIGGVVNLRTRTAREGFHADVSANSGYNDLEKSFNNYKFSANVGNRFFENKIGVLVSGSRERVVRSSDNYEASYGQFTHGLEDTPSIFYATNASVSENRRVRSRTNGALVLDYKNDFMTIKVNNIYTQMVNDNETRSNKYVLNGTKSELNASTSRPDERMRSHSLNGRFDILNTDLEIGLSYSKTSIDNQSRLFVFEDVAPVITDSERAFRQITQDWLDENYNIYNGENAALFNSKYDTIARNDVTKNAKLDWSIPFKIGNQISGKFKIGGKYKLKMRTADKNSIEYDTGTRGRSISRAQYVLDQYSELQNNTTDVDGYSYPGYGIPAINFIDKDYDAGEVLDGQFNLGWAPDLDKVHEYMHPIFQLDRSNASPDGKESSKNTFDTREELFAGYVMAVLNIGSKVMILPGIRYEKMQTEYSSFEVLEDMNDPSGVNSAQGYPRSVSVLDRMNSEFFPSLNTKIDITDWMAFRGAYFKSNSRPAFNQLSPIIIANPEVTDLTVQNPYLKPSIAHNYDLGLSFFATKLGMFTVNAFYKEIDGLIWNIGGLQTGYFDNENVLEGAPEMLNEQLIKARETWPAELISDKKTGSNVSGYPINNPHTAYVKGLEFSWQTNFFYLPGLLQGLVLDINYSIVASDTKYPLIETRDSVISGGLIPKIMKIPYLTSFEGQLPNQTKSLFNLRIGWDYKDFSTRLSFRSQPDVQQGFDKTKGLYNTFLGNSFRVDLNLKQQITDELSVTLNAINITNSGDSRFYRPYTNENFLISKQFYGMEMQLGLRYTF